MIRIGTGYDVHRLQEGLPLWIGGVCIPHTHGLLGHSDADVLLHAIRDALLGAADPAYKGISSLKLLAHVGALLKEHGYSVGNIDSTIVAQRPKLAPYIPQMRQAIADTLGIGLDQVSVKATTTEHLGFEGREEGISSQAVAILI